MRAETEAALEAVTLGLALARRRAGADRVASKGGRDVVTATDVAVEDAVRAALRERFPEWPVVGEERGGESGTGDRPYWLVDPICGTRNFASDLPLYAVNVALVEGGRVTVAAVGDGGTGHRFVGERGQGAWRASDDAPIALRATDVSRTVALATSPPVPEDRPNRGVELFRAVVLADRLDVLVLGTTASLAYVATGGLAAAVFFDISEPFHTAAGCLLAEEAGALVTDHDGRPWTLGTPTVLAAATREVQRDLLDLLATARR
jgi:myo-inositol-1(or 4)-monophosphatase